MSQPPEISVSISIAIPTAGSALNVAHSPLRLCTKCFAWAESRSCEADWSSFASIGTSSIKILPRSSISDRSPPVLLRAFSKSNVICISECGPLFASTISRDEGTMFNVGQLACHPRRIVNAFGPIRANHSLKVGNSSGAARAARCTKYRRARAIPLRRAAEWFLPGGRGSCRSNAELGRWPRSPIRIKCRQISDGRSPNTKSPKVKKVTKTRSNEKRPT